jgi:hypothetical protein
MSKGKPTPPPTQPPSSTASLREAIDEHKWLLHTPQIPCKTCGPQVCYDYCPSDVKVMDSPAPNPWPTCKCGHIGQEHEPGVSTTPPTIPPDTSTKPTLRQAIDTYSWQLHVTSFPCLACADDTKCINYTPSTIQSLDKPCSEPWPTCKCNHTAQEHDPNFTSATSSAK